MKQARHIFLFFFTIYVFFIDSDDCSLIKYFHTIKDHGLFCLFSVLNGWSSRVRISVNQARYFQCALIFGKWAIKAHWLFIFFWFKIKGNARVTGLGVLKNIFKATLYLKTIFLKEECKEICRLELLSLVSRNSRWTIFETVWRIACCERWL